MFELNAGIRGSKAPVDTDRLPIAIGLLGCHLAFHFGAHADARVQTLPSEDREFNLGHVQPTAMLGGNALPACRSGTTPPQAQTPHTRQPRYACSSYP